MGKKKVKDEEPDHGPTPAESLAAFVKAVKNKPEVYVLRADGSSAFLRFGGKRILYYPSTQTAEELPPAEAVNKFLGAEG